MSLNASGVQGRAEDSPLGNSILQTHRVRLPVNNHYCVLVEEGGKPDECCVHLMPNHVRSL